MRKVCTASSHNSDEDVEDLVEMTMEIPMKIVVRT
jgi:hypothetical protein